VSTVGWGPSWVHCGAAANIGGNNSNDNHFIEFRIARFYRKNFPSR
jgi:hypothetical protein